MPRPTIWNDHASHALPTVTLMTAMTNRACIPKVSNISAMPVMSYKNDITHDCWVKSVSLMAGRIQMLTTWEQWQISPSSLKWRNEHHKHNLHHVCCAPNVSDAATTVITDRNFITRKSAEQHDRCAWHTEELIDCHSSQSKHEWHSSHASHEMTCAFSLIDITNITALNSIAGLPTQLTQFPQQ